MRTRAWTPRFPSAPGIPHLYAVHMHTHAVARVRTEASLGPVLKQSLSVLSGLGALRTPRMAPLLRLQPRLVHSKELL